MIEQIKTTKGIYLPSEREDVIEALQTYCSDKTFFDFGSGDGRIIEWARECGAIDPRGTEFEEMATDIRDDAFCTDIDQYQVIFYYSLGCDFEEDLYLWLSRKYTGIFLLNTKNAETSRYEVFGEPVAKLGEVLIFEL